MLVGSGMLNKQVARELNISEKTVKAHLGRIFNRLGVSDRTQSRCVGAAQRVTRFLTGDRWS